MTVSSASMSAWLRVGGFALAALPTEGDDAPRDYLETRASEGALRRVRRAISASAAVAVSLTLRLHPLPVSTLGFLVWSPERGPEITRIFRDVIDTINPLRWGTWP